MEEEEVGSFFQFCDKKPRLINLETRRNDQDDEEDEDIRFESTFGLNRAMEK
jgi:hypothetical protein